MRKFLLFTAAAILIASVGVQAKRYDSYTGLVMCGYQGWGSSPEDGSNRGWGCYTNYGQFKEFKPGSCAIDCWPDVSEYEVTYATPFKYADGTTARICSPADYSTVDTHFRWMKEAGIDGVFMQRFAFYLHPGNENQKAHFDKVFDHAMKAAQKYGRTVALMYDLSGLAEGDYERIIKDWEEISSKYDIYNRKKGSDCYLYHNGKPLLAIWGIGFPDRPYGFETPEKLVKFFKDKNNPLYCSLHLGVPAYWREFGSDCRKDPKLHELIEIADIIHPWTAGRYRTYEEYDKYLETVKGDIAWAEEHGKGYAPSVWPGFSWHNKYSAWAFNEVPRDSGRYLWKQLAGAVNAGAKMIYVSMFDEIEEGTAIFKIAREVPVGESQFVALDDDIPADHFMWLAGLASKALKKGKQLPEVMPRR